MSTPEPGEKAAARELDRGALSCADLAYIEHPGSPMERVTMAIRAYLWAQENTKPDPLGTMYPSLNQWRDEAARIMREGGPLAAPLPHITLRAGGGS